MANPEWTDPEDWNDNPAPKSEAIMITQSDLDAGWRDIESAPEECGRCGGVGQLVRTIGNRATCPYDDTVRCSECDGTGKRP